MLDGYPQNITIKGKVNPATGQMEYEQTPSFAAGVGNQYVTIGIDGSPINYFQWPNNVVVTSGHSQPSLDASCAVASCGKPADPANVITAELEVFGNPVVTVFMCDECYALLNPVGDATTGEHEAVTKDEKPDIVVEEHPNG